ncbi:unnamed protein product [Rhizophagus irregularis]|nr:unnamed protein product [Rhizophagus irregularis]CAB4436221.1 unnamed protein product [Rhizophagus irregularis]
MEIKGPSACFFGIRNGLLVFDFGKQGTERRFFDIRLWKANRNAGRLDDEFETNRNDIKRFFPLLFVGTPERIHEPDFGWKITLTSTSAKLELKWLRSSKRKCLAKVKGMKGKGSAAIGQTGIQYFEAAHWTYGIQHFEGSAAYWTYGIQHFEGSAAYWTYGIQHFEGSAAYWTYGIQHFEGFLLWHWCGLSIDYRISDKYRLSLNNNNCAFIINKYNYNRL